MSASTRWNRAIRHPWPTFAAAFLLAVLGFWPSFFAKLAETPLPHHLHGWSATVWMCLPLAQYALVRSQRREWHRRLGYVSLALAVLVAGSGVYVVRMMAFRNVTDFRLASVKFVWLDLTGILFFCTLVAVAIAAARRRDMRLHVSALAASAFIPLEAALERLFVNHLPSVIPDFDAALYAALISLEVACGSSSTANGDPVACGGPCRPCSRITWSCTSRRRRWRAVRRSSDSATGSRSWGARLPDGYFAAVPIARARASSRSASAARPARRTSAAYSTSTSFTPDDSTPKACSRIESARR